MGEKRVEIWKQGEEEQRYGRDGGGGRDRDSRKCKRDGGRDGGNESTNVEEGRKIYRESTQGIYDFTLSALGCTLTYGSGTGSCLLLLPLLLRRPPELM